MARKEVVLVNGAGGEMGIGLIERLAQMPYEVVALDLRELDSAMADLCLSRIVGDVLDTRLLERLVSEFEIRAIFHLAALLSTRSEFTPETAHEVNVRGTLNLLKLAVEQSRWQGHPVKFLFPSSIAVYGLPRHGAEPAEAKSRLGKIKEGDYLEPITMYGCNKLYCEHLGRYYAGHYRQLAAEVEGAGVDFRAIRFPGLVSALTIPHGGTSDYGPEMLHAAAQGEAYDCFVRPDTQIPFMVMPDAIDALLQLLEAPREALRQSVYNIAAFAPRADAFAAKVRASFPDAQLAFVPDPKRQAIVDTWPGEVDDSAARRDWGFSPVYELDRAFADYLVPNIRGRYRA